MQNYWLMKSEPDAFSINDLKRLKRSPWDGVRNYQARNFMKEMNEGDLIFFYHSSCNPAGIVGTAKVCKNAYPDHTSWDKNSAYYDVKSTPEKPRWFMVDVEFVEHWSSIVTLAELKQHPELADMRLTQKGSRLSVMPITKSEWEYIVTLLKK
ncbi:EVE domain-containing protein [Marinomonas rhizomae]|uniref:Putative RNA-binding protein with PUA-like domain n=1 Tax=Marinomonas rhizomae TaxID=491948 RepID=A0A366JAQ4_9GAMM|nr:EVE domain-containing protein [Marinomonas rhizomae]RBP84116.1 putative RNA-binding protein with PUA-like domain [Marinomonas rhizomae]RNF74449.1 EVE domain-containing protein [Marinomonas rhizomae]